jgi:hypothetical protein
VSYDLRIRDTSRSDKSLGTEIPVVFARDTARTATLGISSFENAPLDFRTAQLSSGCASSACDSPAFTSIDLDALLPANRPERVNVHLFTGVRDARLWAMITLTNNETQEVTTVTPQQRHR